MTDIVETLQNGWTTVPQVLAAAEEIKRLRAELARYEKEDAIKASANKLLLDEVERLRANWEGCADTCSRLHKAIKVLEAERDTAAEDARSFQERLIRAINGAALLRGELEKLQASELLWMGACEVAKGDPAQTIHRLRAELATLAQCAEKYLETAGETQKELEQMREYAAVAYRAGQEEMRERAAAEAEGMDYSPDGAIARSIRALPVDAVDAARREA